MKLPKVKKCLQKFAIKTENYMLIFVTFEPDYLKNWH